MAVLYIRKGIYMVYLDNSATTRQYDEVTDLIYNISKETYGNPSSLHSMGFDAANCLRDARQELESKFKNGGHVVITSGGTEADNTAIFGVARKSGKRGKKIITTAVEHPAVLEPCKRLADDGFDIVFLPVDEYGSISVEALENELSEDTILVSIMTVNNESGTIEPVMQAYEKVQTYNSKHGTKAIFHTDAVQAFGKLSFRNAPFDLISISGHKFHAPKGVGALYIKKGLVIPSYLLGGGHESGMRSGTENTGGIAGMGLAAKLAYENSEAKGVELERVNTYLKNGILAEIKDVKINGPDETGLNINDAGKRCPSVLNISFLGTRGEVLLHMLEQDGIYCSTGSACSSHKGGGSHVLKAMGLSDKDIEGAIRFSFSEFNTIEEMDFVIDRVKAAVLKFRKLGSFR